MKVEGRELEWGGDAMPPFKHSPETLTSLNPFTRRSTDLRNSIIAEKGTDGSRSVPSWKTSCMVSTGLRLCDKGLELRCERKLFGDSINKGNITNGRRIYNQIGIPKPIDCLVSSWSHWSLCDPCEKKRVTQSQMPADGIRCSGNFLMMPHFLSLPGRCIPLSQVCNGDNDCGDGADEDDCKEVIKLCKGSKNQYWGTGSLASGINIFTNALEGVVFDNNYYGGSCDAFVIDQDKYRLPLNLERYSIEVRGYYEFVYKEYESYAAFERSVIREGMKDKKMGPDLHILNWIDIGYNFESQSLRRYLSKIRRAAQSKSKILHVQCTIDIGRYKMKSKVLMFDYEFLMRVDRLPSDYSYGEYRDFIRAYGTHIISDAILGGVYEYALILNPDGMDSEGYTFDDIKSCTQEAYHSSDITSRDFVGMRMDQRCHVLLDQIANLGKTDEDLPIVEDLAVFLRGGTIPSITSLAYNRLPNKELMEKWGDAAKFFPEVLKIKVIPMHEMWTGPNSMNMMHLKNNMRNAVKEYYEETHVCHCAPCLGNGFPIIRDSYCECLCGMGTCGIGCELGTSEGDATGSWSCWTSWTDCIEAKQKRERQCNSPIPGSIKTCPGRQKEERSC
ncbi:complement component C8 beta chain [Gracilinanus agilis]|uniref:complement component C8 beta chain n=1 Tax=Gracilinanus agilis TaxID=191870 RepID=UPI001CFE55C8|nr:complement component C8 beta chain [Gracilinanus agilis]